MNKGDSIPMITVLALKAGDERAFKAVYDHFSHRLYGNLLKLVKSEEIARELLQEMFFKVWEKREHIDPEKSFHAYLFRIAENMAYDFFRKVARDKKLQMHLIARASEAFNHVEERLINKEYHHLLQQAINALPPRRRQVFRLCKLDGKSYEQAALELGLSTSTISDHIVKATHFIRMYCYRHYEILGAVCVSALFTGL